MDGRIDGGVLQWFGHVEKVENDRIAKRICVREYTGGHPVDWPLKK